MADASNLKQTNTALLRKTMGNGRPFSKNELTRETGLSFPTVSRIVDSLAAAGEIKETGISTSTGGRCAKQYALDPSFRLFLCLRLEAHILYWYVSNMAGERLEEGKMPCESGVLQTIDTLLMRVKVRYLRLSAVAMGFDGAMNLGVVSDCFGYPELRGVNLKAYLENKSKLPSAAERDMHLVSVGCCQRRADSPHVLVCIYLGPTGAGASVAVDGHAFHGAGGFAGEIHFLPIENNREYARTHFEGVDMVEYYQKVICSYAALFNPDSVVLYDDPLLADQFEQICRACVKALPVPALPVIELSRELVQDYEAGLFALSRDLLQEETL